MKTDCEHKSGTVLFDNANCQIVQCDYGCGEILTYQKVGGILVKMVPEFYFSGNVEIYNDNVNFSLSDLLSGVVTDNILFVKSDLGETPVVIGTIKAQNDPA